MKRTTETESYFEAQAKDYHLRSQSGLWGRFKRRELKVVLTALKLRPGLRVIDFGCGPGTIGCPIEKNGGVYFGIDQSEAMIRQVEKNQLKGLCQKTEDFESGSSFDAALFLGCLEFSQDHQDLLRHVLGQFQTDEKKIVEQVIVLLPRPGLATWFYNLWHRLQGCPTTTIKIFELEATFKHFGFLDIQTIPATLISTVIVAKH